MKSPIRLAALLGALAIVVSACGPSGTPAPTGSTATQPPASQPTTSEAPASLSGDITLWHSYASGGGETAAFNEALDAVRAANPELNVTVEEQPFDQLFSKWRTEVSAEGGPDMFIAPNDSLGQDAREGSLLNLDPWLVGNAALDGFLPVAIDGSKVEIDGTTSFYMVPESLKAVALWYDNTAITTPPATSADLLAGVTAGTIKLGVNQGVYHQFGWSGAFGGKLLNDDGTCAADDGGFAEAFAYLKQLKDAGATFNVDGGALKTQFQTGEINALIDGPWQTADFRTALGTKLAVAPMPDGPAGAANPFTGTDGWYINPNLDEAQAELAVNLALALVSPESLQIMTDDAGHVPANPTVTISDPITQGFADAAEAGLPRPQGPTFNNWWGPFGNALNEVIDTGADPATAIANACTLMDGA